MTPPASMTSVRAQVTGRPGPLLALALLLPLALGCRTQVAGRANLGPGVEGDSVEAPAPSVPTYRTDAVAGPAVLGPAPLPDAVIRGVDAASAAEGMPLVGDARLAELAQWVAERLGPNGEPPPGEVIEFFASHLGLVEPLPHIVVLGQPPDELEAAIARSVGTYLGRQRYSHYGAATMERDRLHVAVVVLSWRWLTLEPLARRGPGPIRLRGRLLGAWSNPAVAVTAPDGEVRRLPAGSGPDFDVQVPTRDPGRYQVELLGQGENGISVIANFPVYVGVPIPERVLLAHAAEDGEAPVDVEDVRRRLVDLLAEVRAEAGLRPLSEDARLREVALAHSRDMADHGFIGHVSPSTGSPAERLRAAGLHTGLVLENIGRGYAAREIHRNLLGSPGHRANLFNADVTHVGVGVVAEPEGLRTAFLATQVFARLRQVVDLTGASARLMRLVNRARSARGAPTLEERDHLRDAAQAAADAYVRDPTLSGEDAVDEASAALTRFRIAYARVGGVVAVVDTVDEAVALEPTFDPGVRYVGIGVAQGSRPDTGPNAIVVVFVLAWPRG